MPEDPNKPVDADAPPSDSSEGKGTTRNDAHTGTDDTDKVDHVDNPQGVDMSPDERDEVSAGSMSFWAKINHAFGFKWDDSDSQPHASDSGAGPSDRPDPEPDDGDEGDEGSDVEEDDRLDPAAEAAMDAEIDEKIKRSNGKALARIAKDKRLIEHVSELLVEVDGEDAARAVIIAKITDEVGEVSEAEIDEYVDSILEKAKKIVLKAAEKFLKKAVKSDEIITFVRGRASTGLSGDELRSEIIEYLIAEDANVKLMDDAKLQEAISSVLRSVDMADRKQIRKRAVKKLWTSEVLEDLKVAIKSKPTNEEVTPEFVQEEILNSLKRRELVSGVLLTDKEKKMLTRMTVDAMREYADFSAKEYSKDPVYIEEKKEYLIAQIKTHRDATYSEIAADLRTSVLRDLRWIYGAVPSKKAIGDIAVVIHRQVVAHHDEVVKQLKSELHAQELIRINRGKGSATSPMGALTMDNVRAAVGEVIKSKARDEGAILSSETLEELVRAEINHANAQDVKFVDSLLKREFEGIVGAVHEERRETKNDEQVLNEILKRIASEFIQIEGVVIGAVDEVPEGYGRSGPSHRKVIKATIERAMAIDAKRTRKRDEAFIAEQKMVEKILGALELKDSPEQIYANMDGELNNLGEQYEGGQLTDVERARILKLAFEKVNQRERGATGFKGAVNEAKRQWEEYREYSRVLAVMTALIEEKNVAGALEQDPDAFKEATINEFKSKYDGRRMSGEDLNAMSELAYAEALSKYLKLRGSSKKGEKYVEEKWGPITGEMKQLMAAIRPLIKEGWSQEEIIGRLEPAFFEGKDKEDVRKMFEEAFDRLKVEEQEAIRKLLERARKGNYRQRVGKGLRHGWKKAGEGKDTVFGPKGSKKRKIWKYATGAVAAVGTYWLARLAVGEAGVLAKGAYKTVVEAGKAVVKTPGKTWRTLKKRTVDTARFMWTAGANKPGQPRAGLVKRWAKGFWRFGGKVLAPAALALAVTFGSAEGLARGLGGFGDIGENTPTHEVDGETRAAHGGLAAAPLLIRDVGRDGWEAAKRASDFGVTRLFGIAPKGKDGEAKEGFKPEDINHIKLALKDAKVNEIIAKIRKEHPDAGLFTYGQLILKEMHSSDVLSLALAGADLLNVGKALTLPLAAVSMFAGDKFEEKNDEIEYKKGMGGDLCDMSTGDLKTFIKNFDFQKLESTMGYASMTEPDMLDCIAKKENRRLAIAIKNFFGFGDGQLSHRAFVNKFKKLSRQIGSIKVALGESNEESDEIILEKLEDLESLISGCAFLAKNEEAFKAVFGRSRKSGGDESKP